MLPARQSWIWICFRALAVVLLSGISAAALVRLAPGFGTDERALDPRLSSSTLRAIEHKHALETSPFRFYVQFLAGLAHGEAGRSVVFQEPVAQLILERAPL